MVEGSGPTLDWIKLKMTVGVFAAKDVLKIQDSRFPFIILVSVNIPMMPEAPEGPAICLPFVPYLLVEGEDDDEREVPCWAMIARAVGGMFRAPTPPHSKSNMDNLSEVLKTDWKVDKKSKYIFPEIGVDEDDVEPEHHEGKIPHVQRFYICSYVLKGFVK